MPVDIKFDKDGVACQLDFKCSVCGVGINHGEETFNHKQTKVFCKSCTKERRKDGSTLVDVMIPCMEKLAAYSGCDLSKELEELHKLAK